MRPRQYAGNGEDVRGIVAIKADFPPRPQHLQPRGVPEYPDGRDIIGGGRDGRTRRGRQRGAWARRPEFSRARANVPGCLSVGRVPPIPSAPMRTWNQHPGQGRSPVREMVLERRTRMESDQADGAVGKVEMDVNRDVPHSCRHRDGSRHLDPSEHVDAGALGGRDQIAGDRKQNRERAEQPVHGGGGQALGGRQFRLEPGPPIGQPPTEPAANAGMRTTIPIALCRGQRDIVPRIVVGELHHPGPQSDEPMAKPRATVQWNAMEITA